jgi:peptidoglycan/LPS O-acetylase OafA/YrhL
VLDFWRRRALKIYPNHLATTLAALALLAWAGPLLPGGAWHSGIIPNLLLLHAWSPDPYTFISLNGVSWSLACEAFFYLAFPAWLGLLRRVPAERLGGLAIGLILLVAGVPWLASALPGQPLLPWKAVPALPYWFVYIFPPVRALEFLLGMAAARLALAGRWPGLSLGAAGLLFLGSYVLASAIPGLHGFAAVTLAPVALLIAAGARTDALRRPSVLRAPLWVRLGELSFAFYLVHRLVLMYGHRILGGTVRWPAFAAAGLVLAGLGLSLGLAVLLHEGVERRASPDRSRTGPNFNRGAGLPLLPAPTEEPNS